MGRVKMVQIGPGRLGATLARLDTSGDRDQSLGWRRWYKTARWQRLRWEVLRDAAFTCARCGVIERRTDQLVADHVVRHRGDEALFWDRGNLQCLCKPCHDGAKQAAERAADRARRAGGAGA